VGIEEIRVTDIKVFHGVTSAIFACVKTKSREEHGTTYDPPDADSGTATTSTLLGIVVLGFKFDPDKAELTYTLIRKGWMVPISQVWSGIGDTIESCRSSA
jgi:hypothetical protein